MKKIFQWWLQWWLQGWGFGDCTAPFSHEKMKIQELSCCVITLGFLHSLLATIEAEINLQPHPFPFYKIKKLRFVLSIGSPILHLLKFYACDII